MIKVAFTIIGGKSSWMGGINYLKNLLFALSQLEEHTLKPVLLVGKKVDEKLLKEFEGLAEIKQYSVFDRYSVKWFLDVILRDIFNLNPFINQIVVENNIKAISHSYIYGRDLKCLAINWIPDFQHRRLPHMFSKLNYYVRDFRLKALSKYSDIIIFSSNDALEDFKKFKAEYISKTKVIHFVSQTSNFEKKSLSYLEKKYHFSGQFFFLPNQFWVHKNHKVVFEAINLAKEKDKNILLICSGHMLDERNKKYIENLKSYITDNALENNIKLLGKIPFEDVLLLMYYTNSIINPSFFEGWSSTVEESKSMNKTIILSNIAVHIEQAPAKGIFFNPNNPEELANILLKQLSNLRGEMSAEEEIEKNLQGKTIEFASQYESLFKAYATRL
ncbi:glycosyltransferase family 4 protein [Emticicia agri]|nr:glycosyltransferase family 1 protein [Emticicia agri]